MKTYPSILLVLALAWFTAPAQAQELITCSKTAGGAKTNCENSVFISRADHKSDFRILYDFTCRKVFSSHVLVFADKPLDDLTATALPLEIGANRDITLRNSQAVYFGYKGRGQALMSEDCSLTIRDVLRLPSADQTELWKLEARRLADLLDSKGKLYRSIKDYDNLIEKYSVPRLEAMAASLQRMIGSMVDFSLNTSDSGSGFPGSSSEVLPNDFGINAAQWEDINLEALGLISRESGKAQYLVTADRMKHPWYFTAADVLPAIRGLVGEIARVKGAVLLKEQAAEAGFEVPSVDAARQDLEATLVEAKAFMARVEAVKEQLGEEFKRLLKLSQQHSEQG